MATKPTLSARAVGTPSQFDDIAAALAERFADRNDVLRIFLHTEGPLYRALLVIDHEQYDRDAMFQLYEREYHLHRDLNHPNLEVDYIPRLGRSYGDLVSRTAKLIYRS